MKRFARRATALACVASLSGVHLPAASAVQSVELASNGSEVTTALPPGTTEVELATQRAGSCRFGRTWGYDLGARQLWVSGGCAGGFRVHVREHAVPAQAGQPENSNAAAGLAAMAAIAGVAILASQSNKHRHDNVYVPPAPPPPPQGGGYYPPPNWGGGYPQPRAGVIRNSAGMCIDMQGGTVRPNVPAGLFQCHGRANQQFQWSPRSELVVAGMCLDIAGRNAVDGARIVAWNCDGSPTQQWVAQGASIRNRYSGQCIDLANNNSTNQAPIIAYRCHGGQNQRWFW
jgi:hypothetical protein